MKSYLHCGLFAGMLTCASLALAQDPTVELIWRSTTGSGTPGTDTIKAKVGDELELDVIVADGGSCAGLSGAFMTLEWDVGALTGFDPHTCPAPENILLPEILCNDSSLNFIDANPPSLIYPWAQQFIAYTQFSSAFYCGDPLYLGRMKFTVSSKNTTEIRAAGYNYGDVVIDSYGNNYIPPQVTATISCSGCGCPP
jgi:hypothetical protein